MYSLFVISCPTWHENYFEQVSCQFLDLVDGLAYFSLTATIPDVTCKTTFKGTTYRGNVNVTALGLPCQRWDSTLPHWHVYTHASDYPDDTLDEASNYCRNPDNELTVWCFTTTSVRWDFCAVPMCDSECKPSCSRPGFPETSPCWKKIHID